MSNQDSVDKLDEQNTQQDEYSAVVGSYFE